MRIICVCGARPNFMKVAPILHDLEARPGVTPTLVHTGQHYDDLLSGQFLSDLGIRRPDVNLAVGSGSHARQTAEVMRRFDEVCIDKDPDWVVVVGDVNSTLACALTSAKRNLPVAHVEAGLRSFDRTMPEEINRIVVDAVSDLLFASEPSAVENLRSEGIDGGRIHFVGNVMIDSLMSCRWRADRSPILTRLNLIPKLYGVVTLHRPGNVDRIDDLGPILDALGVIAKDHPLVFPMHPRTRGALESSGSLDRVLGVPGLRIVEPLGYLDFLKLMTEAKFVLTDSGGVQEETTILGVPCLTVRENTERPVTLLQGTNHLAGKSRESILIAYARIGEWEHRVANRPDLWDGEAARRIVDVLLSAPIRRRPREPRPAITADRVRMESDGPVGVIA